MRRALFITFVYCLVAFPSMAADYAKAGALRHGDKWEVSVIFDELVDGNLILNSDKYSLGEYSFENIRRTPLANGVILTTTNLPSNSTQTLALTNIVATTGETLPPLNIDFTAKEMTWTGVGGQELGIAPEAFAVGEDGFDLFSGASQLWDRYDEATFAFEKISGDFDKRARVEFQDDSSPWARAGIMVREFLDEGKPRPADLSDPGQAFSRYIEAHVTPADLAYEGDIASNTHEVNLRKVPGNEPGGITENPFLANNAAPAYPNAWVRITRSGQTFRAYRSADGQNWVQLGEFSFPQSFPTVVYVGPSFSPENSNIPVSSGARGRFVARIRDYNYTPGALPIEARIEYLAGQVEITWDAPAMLQRNDAARQTGWIDLPDAKSPHRVAASGEQFFRLKQ